LLPGLDFEIGQMVKNDSEDAVILVGEYEVAISLLPAAGTITPGRRLNLPLT
jgi:hypothetical protein